MSLYQFLPWVPITVPSVSSSIVPIPAGAVWVSAVHVPDSASRDSRFSRLSRARDYAAVGCERGGIRDDASL